MIATTDFVYGIHGESPYPLAWVRQEKKTPACAGLCDRRESESMWQSIWHTNLPDIATLADWFLGKGQLTTGAVVSALLTFSFLFVVCLLAIGSLAAVMK